jgi:hypothetical protein
MANYLIMRFFIYILLSYSVVFWSCHKDDSNSNTENSSVDICDNPIIFGIGNFQNFFDTCYYDDQLAAYLIQLNYNNVKGVIICTQDFGDQFNVSISIGGKTIVDKEYPISLPFTFPLFQFVEDGHSVVTFGGFIAKAGKVIVSKASNNTHIAKFDMVEFFANPRDTTAVKFIASGQIICK